MIEKFKYIWEQFENPVTNLVYLGSVPSKVYRMENVQQHCGIFKVEYRKCHRVGSDHEYILYNILISWVFWNQKKIKLVLFSTVFIVGGEIQLEEWIS